MSKGTFRDFENALRAFESGVDAERYASGQITEWQIRGWVGEQNWAAYQAGALSWRDLQYTSTNSLGFVGYQFGEALLIDLGYYRADTFYGNGAATNTWSGTFTGKGGITSLSALKTDLQEGVMLDAFGYNLDVIESGLAASGKSLDDLIGQTRSYLDTSTGRTVTVELSMTGILAAAHLRGAWGTLDLLQRGAVSSDEYGTSILKYVDMFGGYDAVSRTALVAAHESGTSTVLAEAVWQSDLDGDGTVGSVGTVPPVDDPHSGETPRAPALNPPVIHNPDVPDLPPSGAARTVAIEWAWGTQRVLDFDPATDQLDFGWFQAGQFTLAESGGSVVIAIPSNQQSYTLNGVSFSDLSAANVTALDGSARAAWAAALGDDVSPSPPDPVPVPVDPVPPNPPVADPDPGPTDPGSDGSGRTFRLATNGPDIVGFDTAHDTLDAGIHSVHNFIVVDTAEGVGFRSPWNGDVQLVRGVRLADLDAGDFTAIGNQHLREDISGALAWEAGVSAAPGTVYARSHEVGQVDRTAFDPATDVVDFRYFGTRELVFMRQGQEGVEIGNDATGQKLILLGTDLGDLSGRNFVFHPSQVREDHLDTQLGVTYDPANVKAQTFAVAGGGSPVDDPTEGMDDHGGDGDQGGQGDHGGHGDHTGHSPSPAGDGVATVTAIGWSWGSRAVLAFDPSEDKLDFGWMGRDSFSVRDTSAGLAIDILGNDQSYLLAGVHPHDLSIDDVLADDAGTRSVWHDLIPHTHDMM